MAAWTHELAAGLRVLLEEFVADETHDDQALRVAAQQFAALPLFIDAKYFIGLRDDGSLVRVRFDAGGESETDVDEPWRAKISDGGGAFTATTRRCAWL